MPGKLPVFMDIEFTEADGQPVPTAIAWSLPDGRMKTVVIAPDDEWLDEDGDLPGADLAYLEEQGVPLIELGQALHEDLPDLTVYIDGLDPDDELAEKIFEAVGLDCPFELVPATELFALDTAEFEDRRRQLMTDHALEPHSPEDVVMGLLLLARDEGLIEDDA